VFKNDILFKVQKHKNEYSDHPNGEPVVSLLYTILCCMFSFYLYL